MFAYSLPRLKTNIYPQHLLHVWIFFANGEANKEFFFAYQLAVIYNQIHPLLHHTSYIIIYLRRDLRKNVTLCLLFGILPYQTERKC